MPEVRILPGDCRAVMRTLDADSIAAVVTDPPYGLSREPDMAEVLRHWLAGDDYEHGSAGFMGRAWDSFVPGPAIWREAIRVLAPGGYCLAFFGTRTYDMGVTAMRLAGFEIREMQAWLHGQGMNKVGYLRDADGRHLREGWAGSIKPALEPIVMARKPLSERTLAANMRRWGTGALNIDACRVPAPEGVASGGCKGHNGTGWGFGDRPRVPHPAGRWPANLSHDGSQAVLDLFPQSCAGAGRPGKILDTPTGKSEGWGNIGQGPNGARFGDSGSAARFFYCAKASASDRAGSKHPTVKPRSLMRHLVRLVTPPGGTVLDPFAGSGSTLQAARDEGFDAIGIEREPEFVADCHRRLGTSPPAAVAAA